MSDKLESDETVDVVAAVRRAAPEVPSHRSVELVANRAWRLSASRRRVEWLHVPRVMALLTLVALAVATVAGISAVRSARSAQLAQAELATTPELATALRYRVDSPDALVPLREATSQVGFVPLVIDETNLTGVLRGALLTERSVGAGRTPDNLILGLEYENLHFAQYRWPDEAHARDALVLRMADDDVEPWVDRVTVEGHSGFWWTPDHRRGVTDGSGRGYAQAIGTTSGLIWVDGAMHYTLTSDSLDDDQLLEIARSLYQ